MSAPRSDRPTGQAGSGTGADEAPEAAGEAGDDAHEAQGAAGCPLLPDVMTAETVPVTALVTLPAWTALARLLRARKPNEVDAAIADAIDAVTEAL